MKVGLSSTGALGVRSRLAWQLRTSPTRVPEPGVCTVAWYSGILMIESWHDTWLKDYFERDVHSKKIPADLRDRLFRKLQLLDDATTDADLRVPVSNHFEKLRGKLEGWHSIRVGEQWRLIFKWSEGKATEVYLDDHSYR
jgi:proteic killer suppression protein